MVRFRCNRELGDGRHSLDVNTSRIRLGETSRSLLAGPFGLHVRGVPRAAVRTDSRNDDGHNDDHRDEQCERREYAVTTVVAVV
jgi:hypothetical protein